MIDLGTLGGPTSGAIGGHQREAPAQVAGYADTEKREPTQRPC